MQYLYLLFAYDMFSRYYHIKLINFLKVKNIIKNSTIKINSLETMGALDGPGLRTVIFLQGCPLRCKYCHNADTFDINGGQDKSMQELVEFCLRYKAYHGDNGGVTISGGEPLFQEEALYNLILALKRENLNVALDTSGVIFSKRVFDNVDLVLLDIKHTDAIEFKKLCGGNLSDVLKTLDYFKNNNIDFWTRQVIVSGITDSKEQVSKFNVLSNGAKKKELLAYHKMGIDKWAKIGLDYPLKDTEPPSIEKMKELNSLLTFV